MEFSFSTAVCGSIGTQWHKRTTLEVVHGLHHDLTANEQAFSFCRSKQVEPQIGISRCDCHNCYCWNIGIVRFGNTRNARKQTFVHMAANTVPRCPALVSEQTVASFAIAISSSRSHRNRPNTCICTIVTTMVRYTALSQVGCAVVEKQGLPSPIKVQL